MIHIFICNFAFGVPFRPSIKGFALFLGTLGGVALIASGAISFIVIVYFTVYVLALTEIQYYISKRNKFNDIKKKRLTKKNKTVFDCILTETFTVNMIKYNIEVLQFALPKLNEAEKIIINNILLIYENAINVYNKSKKAHCWYFFRVRYVISYSQQFKIKNLLNQIKNENI